jgi:hypothetical protein
MNRIALALAAALSIISSAAYSPEASAVPPIARTYDWTIEIDTQELPRQFQYTGSALTQVVKAEVLYYSGNDQSHATKYETLWYSNGHTLGLERQNKLQIRQGDAIAIDVVHKSSSAQLDEQRAAARAIMKALIDANINKNMVATIKVPLGSFSGISQEIQNYRFTPVSDSSSEDPTASNFNIYMESKPAGVFQQFAHLH